MPNYLVMIYDNEAAWVTAEENRAEELMKEHVAFAEANGRFLRGGDQLAGSETATSIRQQSDGSISVTDGTFAETKEVLGGYYVIEAADLDEALTVAKQVPMGFGGLEVRPLVER
jgi:hypothetical protein